MQGDRVTLGMSVEANIYVQDPLIAKSGRFGIHKIRLDRDPYFSDGPTSSRIAVVDYNFDTKTLAKPAECDDKKEKFVGADNPASVFFHQVNVWAITQNILSFFEDPTLMGRPLPWAFSGNRLIILPHAGKSTTIDTCYNRKGKCLTLSYSDSHGATVYDGLSHDVVAHEIGHAILDGIRPHYYNSISLDTLAFHEFIADFTAVLSPLIIRLVRHQVADTYDGNLKQAKVLCELGEQKASENFKQYIRNALNKTTMEEVKNNSFPHDRSQPLTGAMFEILDNISSLRMKKEKDTPKQALKKVTQDISRIAFRALDYCPPVDIQFTDYLDALVRADEIEYPADEFGYRKVIRTAFNYRGIRELDQLLPLLDPAELNWKYELHSIATSRAAAYHFLHDNRCCLDIPENQDFEIADLYYTTKTAGLNRKLPREIVVEYVWRESFTLEGTDFGKLKNRRIPLLCGGTLVFDELGNILYRCRKAGTSTYCTPDVKQKGEERVKELVGYIKMIFDKWGENCAERLLDGANKGSLGFVPPRKISATGITGSEQINQKSISALFCQNQLINTPKNISPLEFDQLLHHLKSVSHTQKQKR